MDQQEILKLKELNKLENYEISQRSVDKMLQSGDITKEDWNNIWEVVREYEITQWEVWT